MAARPDSYSWLSTSSLQVAGCVTVIVGADPETVEAAFGAEPPTDDGAQPGEDGAWAWFVHGDGATIVIEDNGFEGTREEVLGPTTRGAARAASIFWNVNGLIQFTSARRGKLTGTIDLGCLDESELEEIPRSLRPLAALCSYDDIDEDAPEADLIAVGAAMVEKFTGTSFGPEVLKIGQPRRLVPPASKLHQVREWTLSRRPTLRAGIEALSPSDQRALASWVARAAITEAGMDNEPQVAGMLAQLGDPEAVPIALPGLEALGARRARASDARYHAALENNDLHHSLEGRYETQRDNAVYIARHLTHPDPLAAALICADAACGIFGLSTLERRDVFREDDTGRSLVGQEPNPRAREFVDLLERLTRTPSAQWEAMRTELPPPLTADEKTEAIRRDHARRDLGEFRTYQILPSAHMSEDDGAVFDWESLEDGPNVILEEDED